MTGPAACDGGAYADAHRQGVPLAPPPAVRPWPGALVLLLLVGGCLWVAMGPLPRTAGSRLSAR